MNEQSNSEKAGVILDLFGISKKGGVGTELKSGDLTLPSLALELGPAKLMAKGGNETHVQLFDSGLSNFRIMTTDLIHTLYDRTDFSNIGIYNPPIDTLEHSAIKYLNCAFPASLTFVMHRNPTDFEEGFINNFRNELEYLNNALFSLRLNLFCGYLVALLAINDGKILTTQPIPNFEVVQLLLSNLRSDALGLDVNSSN